MGMTASIFRFSEEELNSFLKNSELFEKKAFSKEAYNSDWELDIGKAWDGIQYILTGEGISGLDLFPNSKERALFSGQHIDKNQDFGYGPAHYLTPNQVKETSFELQKISAENLREEINTSDMDAKGVYPSVWDRPDSVEFLIEMFTEFQAFYHKAACEDEAIFTVVC